ncbi:hypothetical protein [Asticcacaulis endophyticus]|uniref:Uncharacterized protein n=1 Tax=Asticcacaulis endophyticus TaxID=1395890 RepID=A0A918PT68_9CAUL|nr:hypothetical protein [Asticcacaulis endophyticus]GGZ21869.1 hypothetical protein GCM10011273_03320 [Asticcacaulis endophyticus]
MSFDRQDRLRNGLEPIKSPQLGISIVRLIGLRQWQNIAAIEGRSIDAVRAQYDGGYKREASISEPQAADKPADKPAWNVRTRRRMKHIHGVDIKLTGAK